MQTILKGVLFYLISVFDSPKNCTFLPKTNKVLADVQTKNIAPLLFFMEERFSHLLWCGYILETTVLFMRTSTHNLLLGSFVEAH